jgi:hypothetical protein
MLDPRADDESIRWHAGRSVQATRAALSRFDLPTGCTAAWFQGELNGLAVACQARPVDNNKTLSGRIGRMVDPLWWSKNLRREMRRENETIEHAAGLVRKKTQCYVSNHAMHVTARRAKANRLTLEGLEVSNDSGEAINLADVSDASVSNPKLRRAELMTRCRGFEETAAFFDHEGIFLTITCPSRFHRFGADGKPNKNWQGETPRDAQNYLNNVWQKIRAAWKRRGYTPYGFRVAEPHHDGCPHWHILLFCAGDCSGWFKPHSFLADSKNHGHGVIGIAGAYALEDSPTEPGALKHRFTVKRIDPSKGSATGYIAKYICKNIDGIKEDGGDMGLDFASGTKAAIGAARVRTWASTWSIRQFQQVGGPSVTVWRELRKYRDDADKPVQLDIFKVTLSYADAGKWFDFWMAQGGPESGRESLLKPKWVEDGGTGKYGEPMMRIYGVRDSADLNQLIVRTHVWTVQKAGTQDIENIQVPIRYRRSLARKYPELVKVGAFDPAPELKGRIASPWTGVNNCTDSNREADDRAEKMDFERHALPAFRGWEGKTTLESHQNGQHYRQ